MVLSLTALLISYELKTMASFINQSEITCSGSFNKTIQMEVDDLALRKPQGKKGGMGNTFWCCKGQRERRYQRIKMFTSLQSHLKEKSLK